jgi:hypothetical protein
VNTLRIGAFLMLLGALTAACSSDDKSNKDESSSTGGSADESKAGGAGEAGTDSRGGSENDALEIIGKYSDNFGFEQIITATSWNESTIAGYDNDKNIVYTQFPEDNEFSPSKFAKTVYTEPDEAGSFYFCMVEFSLDTLAEAEESTTTADDSDPDNGGCGGKNPWTKATPE